MSGEEKKKLTSGLEDKKNKKKKSQKARRRPNSKKDDSTAKKTLARKSPESKICYSEKNQSCLSVSAPTALGTAGGIVGGILGFIFAGPALFTAGIGVGAAAWVGGTLFGAAGVVSGQQTGKIVFGNIEYSKESFEPLSKKRSSIAVFSDIDETLTCKHDPFYAKHGALYPGIVEFLIGLSRGQKNMEPMPINFLSARAGDTVPFVRLNADHPIVKTVQGSGGEVGSFLYGHVQDQLMRVFGKHSRWAALGRTKVRNLIKYMKEQSSNLKAVFVGDDTEGDLMAGIYLLRNCPEVSAVFIHRVKKKHYRIQAKFANDPRLKRLFFYNTTAEAAMIGYSEGMLSLLSLMNIYNAVGRSNVSKEYRNIGTQSAGIYNERVRFENDFKSLEVLIIQEQKINELMHAKLQESKTMATFATSESFTSSDRSKKRMYCTPQEPQNIKQMGQYITSSEEFLTDGDQLHELSGEFIEEKADVKEKKFGSIERPTTKKASPESIWTHTELRNYLQEHSISVSNDNSNDAAQKDMILLELDDFARQVELEDELERKTTMQLATQKQQTNKSPEKEKLHEPFDEKKD